MKLSQMQPVFPSFSNTLQCLALDLSPVMTCEWKLEALLEAAVVGDELMSIPGIGPRRLQQIQALEKVGSAELGFTRGKKSET